MKLIRRAWRRAVQICGSYCFLLLGISRTNFFSLGTTSMCSRLSKVRVVPVNENPVSCYNSCDLWNIHRATLKSAHPHCFQVLSDIPQEPLMYSTSSRRPSLPCEHQEWGSNTASSPSSPLSRSIRSAPLCRSGGIQPSLDLLPQRLRVLFAEGQIFPCHFARGHANRSALYKFVLAPMLLDKV